MGIIIRQSIKATLFNYVGAFIGFLTTFFVLTKFVEPEIIGLTKVIYEVSAMVAGFAQLGTSASAMRFFPYFRDPKNNHNGFFFYLMLMPAVGSVVFIGLFLLLREPIVAFFQKDTVVWETYYDWLIPMIIFLTFWTVLETYSSVLLRIVVPKFIKEIGIRVLLLVIYLLYALHVLDVTGLVIAYISVYGIAMLALFVYISRITSVSLKHNFAFIDRELGRKIMKYTLFLLLSALSGNIIWQLDLFMVSAQEGFDDAGIYTIAAYMAFAIELPARSITSISSPLAATALKEGDWQQANRLYQKVSLHQFMASTILFLLLWINIDNIFDILPNGEIYGAGKWVVFFIALSKIISVTLSFGGTLISFSRYYYWGLYFTFFLTALTITTNYFFIPLWGISGAALATLLTCIVSYTFQQWIVMWKIKGNPYTWGIVKQLSLVLLLFALNELLPCWAGNPFIDLAYRSLIFAAIWLILAYRFRVSEEFCRLVRSMLNKLSTRG